MDYIWSYIELTLKYEISGSSYFYIDEVKYNTDKGTKSDTYAAARSFSTICGPVKKGFHAEIEITRHRGYPKSNEATKISVSKNNGPFTVKKSGTLSASYSIDF